MNCSVKKLISIYLTSSMSFTCCLANNNVSDVDQHASINASVSKISDKTWEKIEKMTSDNIKKLFYISYDMLPFQYREKLDRPGYKIKKGFNVQAARHYNRSSVKKFAEKNSYKFIEVDLGLQSSIDKFKDFVDNRSENEVIIVYIHTIRCSDVNSYLENVLESLKNHKFGIFVNCFEKCENKKCMEHKRMENLIDQFEFYDMQIDTKDDCPFPHRHDNVDSYCNIIKKFLKRLDACLDGNLGLNTEQFDAIYTLFGECTWDYDYLEKLFIDAFSTLSAKKTLDFDSIFSTLISYIYVNPEQYGWSEEMSRTVSLHEMGHAFMMKNLGMDVTAIVLNADFSGVTYNLFSSFGIKKHLNYKTYEHMIMSYLAGKTVQDLLDTGADPGCGSDMQNALRLAKQALQLKDPAFKFKDETEQKKLIFELFEKLQKKVEDIILDNEEVIRKLADELMKKSDVNGIKFIIGSEFDKLYEKFMEEAESKKKFLEENRDDIDEVFSKISQNPEAWNSIKSSLGIKTEEKENKDERSDKALENTKQDNNVDPKIEVKN